MSPALNLVIPGISELLSRLLADSRAAEILPGFYRYVCKASQYSIQPENPYIVVADLLDIPRGWTGQFPHASYSRYAENGIVNRDVWLNLSPVSYVSASSGLILNGLEPGQISSSDAEQLSRLLQSDSASENQPVIEKSDGASWCVNASLNPDVQTTPLYEVIGRPVVPCLPSGSDATYWAKTMAEWEMMLHSSELNQERVARGQEEISSFWLWGEGSLPDNRRGGESALLLTDDRASTGMARFHHIHEAGFSLRAIENNVDIVVAAEFSLMNSAVLPDGMQEWLTDLDESWIGPAIHLIQQKTLASFSIMDPSAGVSWRLNSMDLKKFWRNSPRLKRVP